MGISSYENLTRNINQLGGVDTTAGETGDVLTLSSDGIWRPANPAEGQVLNTELTGFSATVGTVTDSDTVLSGFEKLQGSVSNLENKHVTTTRFATISSGTSGSVTLPANSTVKLDDFGGTVDAIITGITGGRPNNQPALSSGGAVVATTFDASGNYSLSVAPSSYPVAIIYRVTQDFKDFDSTSSDIHGDYEVIPTHDGLVNIGGGVASNHKHYAIFSTTVQAKAATPTGPTLAFIEDKEGIYLYCTDCSYPADDDLVLTTGNGGNTRWELAQKMSRTQGDTGWINTDNATLTKTSSTQMRLSITSTSSIAIKGKRIAVPIGNYDVTLSGTGGPKFIGFNDETLALSSQDSLWDFNTQVPVAVCYWSGTAIVAAPQTEFHGIRDTVWHSWAHKFLGTQYVSGLSFTGKAQPDNNTNPGADDTVSYLWSTAGVIQDEDFQSTPGTGQWLQTLGSGLTSTTAAIFNFFYFNGTVITTAAAMADRSPFIHSGTTPQWENAGVLTNAVSNDYIVYHYFASPMIDGWSVFARPHNAKYTSLALARAARPSQLTWTNYAELKHLYTAIFRVNTAWGNTHDCKLVALDDYRTIPGTPTAATAPTAHSSLSALELAGSGVAWGHVDDQAQTIAGVKTFESFPVTPNVDPTTDYQVANKRYADTRVSVTSVGSLINGAAEKTTPVDADMVGLMDSAASNALKKLSWSNIKAKLYDHIRTGATTAPSAGYIGEKISGTERTVTTSSAAWAASSSAVLVLGAGVYVIYLYVRQSGGTLTGRIAVTVSTNNNNDSTGSIIPGTTWDTFAPATQGDSTIAFQASLEPIYYNPSGSTSLFAKVYASAGTNNAIVGGFAIRIA